MGGSFFAQVHYAKPRPSGRIGHPSRLSFIGDYGFPSGDGQRAVATSRGHEHGMHASTRRTSTMSTFRPRSARSVSWKTRQKQLDAVRCRLEIDEGPNNFLWVGDLAKQRMEEFAGLRQENARLKKSIAAAMQHFGSVRVLAGGRLRSVGISRPGDIMGLPVQLLYAVCYGVNRCGYFRAFSPRGGCTWATTSGRSSSTSSCRSSTSASTSSPTTTP